MLPYNLHASSVYPLLAPNGSTVIVCGHDHGVYVLWRGGRPFKASQMSSKTNPKINGKSTADNMPIDDDGDTNSLQNNDSLFEEEEEEVDPANPYHPIVQDLDISLGTGVLHMSFPRLLSSSQPVRGEISPAILEDNLVVALACADSTVKILTVPLVPPTPQMKSRPELRNNLLLSSAGHGSWNEQLITVSNTSGHHSLPKTISIAFIRRSVVASIEDAVDDDDEEEDQSHNKMSDGGSDDTWNILVAYVGSDQPSDFAIHKIPISEDGLYIDSDSIDKDSVWRTQPLVNPVVAIDLYVPSKFENEEGPYLLLAEASGAVRIYDCCASTEKRYGSWFRSLFPGFEISPDGRTRYRIVLDAKWVLQGHAIAVLTADGEWGVWNISFEKLNTEGNVELINGGIPTKFSLNGWVGRSTITNIAKSSSGKLDVRSKLAPMTPSTRKIRQEALFNRAAPGPNKSASGGIIVRATRNGLDNKQEDETILLWHADKIIIIPSLLAHWQSKIQGSGNLFGNGASGQIRDIGTTDIGGELRSSVSVFPQHHSFSQLNGPIKQSDILVSGNRSLVILTTPISEPTTTVVQQQEPPSPVLEDQQLLAQGELDVSGMDRILDSMSNGTHSNGLRATGMGTKTKVNFSR